MREYVVIKNFAVQTTAPYLREHVVGIEEWKAKFASYLIKIVIFFLY